MVDEGRINRAAEEAAESLRELYRSIPDWDVRRQIVAVAIRAVERISTAGCE